MSLSTPTAKYGVLISAVDPSQNIIQGILKTGGTANIAMFSKPPAFRWPQVGESWMARQENGTWILDGLWPDASNPEVFVGDPGDLVLNSATGTVRVQGVGDSYAFTKSSFPQVVVNSQPVLDVGVPNQIRAGRQLASVDFISMGLSNPIGLWNLSDVTDSSGNAHTLTNKGTVTFTSGINGTATTAAQFTGSTAQALYIVDTGSSDPFRITTGSWGCWFRTAKRGTFNALITKYTATLPAWWLQVDNGNLLRGSICLSGTTATEAVGATDVVDDRWHFAVTTYDGTTLRIYVDGFLDVSVTTAGGPILGTAAPVNIGSVSADASTVAGNAHYGRVDEAFVTSDVLSEEQVRMLYCAKIPHGASSTPNTATLNVRRQRKGSPWVIGDFTGGTPLRLHNFTAGALTDAGTNNVTLTNNNTALSVVGADGASGGAFNFVSGSTQSLSSTDTGLPSGTASRSYGCWLKTTNISGRGILGWGAMATADARILTDSSGNIATASAGDLFTGPFIADGLWHFVVVVEDNGALDGIKRKLYVDGKCVGGSTTLNSITLVGSNRFRVGGNPDGVSLFFTGLVDGVFVCNYALTAERIFLLYAKGSQVIPASPKDPGAHIEGMDATNIYVTFDTIDSQHQIDLRVAG